MNDRPSRGRLFGRAAVIFFIALGFTLPVSADVLYYSAEVGDNVTFGSIQEESTSDTPPLYGDPDASGNALLFPQIASLFNAFSDHGSSPDLTKGILTMTIAAGSGFSIDTVNVSEGGAYTVAGTGATQTYASVQSTISIKIIEVDFSPLDEEDWITFQETMTFAPKASGIFDLENDGGAGVGWTGEISLDVMGALAASSTPGDHATKIEFSISNELFAQSESGSTSLIDKKQLEVAVIPEPSMFMLLLCGGLMFLQRR